MRIYHGKRFGNFHEFLHLIEKTEWKNTTERLVDFHIQTYCGQKFILAKTEKYEVYSKKKHRKDLCLDCMRIVQLKIKALKKSKG